MKRVAIIGASGAIGHSLAALFTAQPGTETVYACSRNGSGFSDTGISDTKVINIALNLEDASSIADAASKIPPASLDLVIVATGLLHAEGEISVQPEKSLQQLEADALAKTFRVNSIGPALVMKYFLPLLRKDSRSVFAALSARVGSITDNRLGGWYGYRASKAALNMLIKTAAIEMRRQNPRAIVAGLHPGTVDSALSKPFQARVPAGSLFSPALAAEKLATVLDGLDPDDSGKCLAWDGREVPA